MEKNEYKILNLENRFKIIDNINKNENDIYK